MEDKEYNRFKELVTKKKSGAVVEGEELKELISLMAEYNLENMDHRDLAEFYFEARVQTMTADPKDLDDELEFVEFPD
jgi:hypothetical protein